MKIQADKDGISVINQLCDIALKHVGLACLSQINTILQSVSEIKEDRGDLPILEAEALIKKEAKAPTKTKAVK